MRFENIMAIESGARMSSEVQELFDIVFKDSPLKTFAYFRFYDSGCYKFLCNNSEWLRFCIENVTTNNDSALGRQLENLNNEGRSYFLWPMKKNDYVFNAMYEHNIWGGLSVFKRNSDYIELWGFAGTRQKELGQEFFFDNINKINSFINLFNISARNLIDQAKIAYYDDVGIVGSSGGETKKAAHQAATRLPVLVKNKEIFLSRKHYNILKAFAVSKSIKAATASVNLSQRTLERELREMKKILGADDNSCLINSYLDTQRWISWMD